MGLRRPAALRLQQPTAGSTPKRTEYLALDWACGLAMGPSQQHERLKLLDRVEGSKQLKLNDNEATCRTYVVQ